MQRCVIQLATIGLLALVCGCTGKKPLTTESKPDKQIPADSIAVIDLNVVAQEIGAMGKINHSLKERENELVGKLNGLKNELGRQLDEIKSKYGSDLNQQQQSDLDRMLTDHQQTIGLQVQAAQTQLAAHHAQLKRKLLDQVRPVAYEVACEKGMNLVLTTSQIYAAGPNVDITQQVIKRIQNLNAKEQSSTSNSDRPIEHVANGGGDFLPVDISER